MLITSWSSDPDKYLCSGDILNIQYVAPWRITKTEFEAWQEKMRAELGDLSVSDQLYCIIDKYPHLLRPPYISRKEEDGSSALFFLEKGFHETQIIKAWQTNQCVPLTVQKDYLWAFCGNKADKDRFEPSRILTEDGSSVEIFLIPANAEGCPSIDLELTIICQRFNDIAPVSVAAARIYKREAIRLRDILAAAIERMAE